jgi:hypothetical protein
MPKDKTQMLPNKLTALRAAIDNLMKIMNTENIDIAFIQEPYVYQNRIKGITKGYRTYTYGEEKSRANIIIPNDTIDAINARTVTWCYWK